LGFTTGSSMIENHRGYISVEPESGVGTRFDIYLPASEKKIVKDKVAEEIPTIGIGCPRHEAESVRHGAEPLEAYKKAKESAGPFDKVWFRRNSSKTL